MNQLDPSSFPSDLPPAMSQQSSQKPRLLAVPRRVPMGEGAAWIGDAWGIFKKRPGKWLLMFLILCLIMLVTSFVPGLNVLTGLLTLFFTGGLMFSCDALVRKGELEVSGLFAGFSRKFKDLSILTLLCFGIILAMFSLMVVIALFSGRGGYGFQAAFGNDVFTNGIFTLLMMLVFFLLLISVMMSVIFSPALVVLNDVPPLQAMKMSFKGCMRNLGAFFVNGLVWFGITMVVGMMFAVIFSVVVGTSAYIGEMNIGAVIAYLLVIPVYFIFAILLNLSYYTCYRSIWTDPPLRGEEN